GEVRERLNRAVSKVSNRPPPSLSRERREHVSPREVPSCPSGSPRWAFLFSSGSERAREDTKGLQGGIHLVSNSERPASRTQRRPRGPPPPSRLCGRGRASLTFTTCPLSICPFTPSIAACASALAGISTKPNPLDTDANLSLATSAELTFPNGSNAWRRS